MSAPLERLGEEVRRALGDGPGEERRSRQRALVLDKMSRVPMRSSRMRRRVGVSVGALALAAAALLAFLTVFEGLDTPLTCTRPRGESVEAGAWLEAGTSELPLRFSEGSRVVMQHGARARVAQLDAERVHLILEEGAIRSDVRSARGRVWSFEAGPYRVRVVGTRLSVEWDVDAQRLRVHVDKGRVKVFGGNLTEEGLSVRAGETLEADHRASEVSISTVARSTGVSVDDGRPERARQPERDDTMETADPLGSTSVDSAAPARRKRSGRHSQRLRSTTERPERAARDPKHATWDSLARSGQYREATLHAESVGIDRLTDTLPPWDLLLLGDALRLGGRPRVAERVLIQLRSRFGSHETARVAAFRLGRIASDQRRDFREAARWFETYLRESPKGSLSVDARGRWLEALARLGRRAQARKVAERYLKESPDGPYAPLARSFLTPPGAAASTTE